MRQVRLKYILPLLVLLLSIFAVNSALADSPVDSVAGSKPATGPANAGVNNTGTYHPEGGVLYSNGQLYNIAGSPARSRLQDTSLGMTIFGFGHAQSTGFRVADDFTVPAGETWTLTGAQFYSYQTGSTTTSTINNLNLRIWSGTPGTGTIVFGDTTTNRLATTAWDNGYRDQETAPTATNRPIMVTSATINVVLTAGTYWIDWQTGGTLASGPWAPPITITGQTTTGNALQFDPGTSTWNPALDTTFPQDFPFVIEGTGGTGPTPTATATTGGATPTATATATPQTGNRICNNTPVTIPDNLPSGATSTINVATAGNISDINVVLSATHTFAGDLIFNLSNGTTNVTFYDRPGVPATTFGCGGDNIPGSIADDEGTTGSWELSCGSGTPAFQPGGTYTNNNPLSAFDGAAAAGTWTLTVSDNAGADTGTLDGWCVDINGSAGPTPTATATTGAAPDINVTPNAFTENHATPQTTNDTMNIQNVGGGTLNWSIVEDNSVTPVEDITDKVTVPAQDVRLRAANGSVVADRFLQSGAMAPSVGTINLVVDDGTPEDSIGLTAGGEFIWLNRFTPAPTDFPFTLTSIEFLTIGTSGCLPTDTVDFYVYTDADGNPANGATHVGSLTGQLVGTLDQYNTYPTNINVTGSGDVLILAVNRTCDIGGQFPASIDLTASQVRSWVGFGGTPGDPPTLPATTFGTIDSFGFPGNWTIRGNGTQGAGGCSAPSDIPWLTVSPTSGSTAGGGSSPVTLTYNSASLANGTYTANLCIESDDADEPTVTVPITLNVGGPTAIDLSSFTSPMSGVNFGDIAVAGLLLLAGAVLVLRRK